MWGVYTKRLVLETVRRSRNHYFTILPGSNICTGDGGGGFIFKNVVEDRYYIKGILSVGLFNDLGECYLNQYSAYTSILYNIEFVKFVLNKIIL